MTLSRGEQPVQVVESSIRHAVPDAPAAVMIAVAASPRERVRLAELADDATTVLLVATAEEAIAYLSQPTSVPARPAVGAVVDLPLDRPGDRSPHRLPGLSLDRPVTVVVDLPVVMALPDPDALTIDSDWRVAKWRDRTVDLSPLEHDLLQCLLEDVGRTWTFQLLQQRVWGNNHLGGRSHLQAVVKRLRRKLVDLRAPLQVDSVRGIGLRLLHTRTETPAS